MLIIVALLVFYNEINSKMNIAEYILLAISLIAIVTAAVNYTQINTVSEGFAAKAKANKKNTNTIIMNSEESEEYLDSDEPTNMNINNSFVDTTINIDNAKTENKKSNFAINEINELLGINDVSKFTDIPTPTKTEEQEIKSVFSPKIIIGKSGSGSSSSNSDIYDSDNYNGFGSKGNSYNWNTVFKNDGFKFNDTMSPDVNLWRDQHGYYNGGHDSGGSCKDSNGRTQQMYRGINPDQWSQNMDDYNKGKWNRNFYNRPSDYVDYTTPSVYGTTTPDSSSNSSNSSNSSSSSSTSKKCAQYDDLDEDQAGNLVIKNYTDAKKWVAGYTYVPPVNWDVPQKHAPVCKTSSPNVQKLTGLIDRGLPINALELNSQGKIADTEDSVSLTNVGSMIPKFNYQEEPFSKPYV
jgi:hypothetical protein